MNCGAMPIANMSSITGTTTSFSLRKRSGNALQPSASGPLKRACIARIKTMAVTRRPTTAIAVNAADIANEPLKIKNSPTNPFKPGKPSEHDRANHQCEQPRTDDFDFVREQREQQAHETVNAHFR